jgi:ubiquilin
MDLQIKMMQEMVNNPDVLKSLLDSPFVKHMMSSPGTMQSLMETNPQLREVMERNPEIIQTMSDPELMRRMIEVVRSPAMLQELMRGQEHLVGIRAPSSTASASPTKKDQGNAGPRTLNGPTGIHDFFGDAGTRSLLQQIAINPQLMTNMLQAPYVESMLNSMSSNPQLIQQMVANSHLFSSNPELMENLPQVLPFFAQQLENPEVQSILSNQKAL